MTEAEKNEVLRNLPSIRDDMGWVTLPIPQRRDAFNWFAWNSAQLYQLGHTAIIATVGRERVERRFYQLLETIPWELLEPVITQPTKENLYPLIMLARLRGEPLPAPVAYFAP